MIFRFLQLLTLGSLSFGAHGVQAQADVVPQFLGRPKHNQGEDFEDMSKTVGDIIDGKLLLYDLKASTEAYTIGGFSYKGQVQGKFCRMSMQEQKDDPSRGQYYVLIVLQRFIVPYSWVLTHLFSTIFSQLGAISSLRKQEQSHVP